MYQDMVGAWAADVKDPELLGAGGRGDPKRHASVGACPRRRPCLARSPSAASFRSLQRHACTAYTAPRPPSTPDTEPRNAKSRAGVRYDRGG